MAVTQPDPVQIEANPAQSIPPMLAGYRQRIARERRRRYLSTALLTVGVVWVISAILYYSDATPSFLLPLGLALSILLPVAALAYAAMRQPSINDTAQALDARLDNQQRLVTSIELLDDEQLTDKSKIQNPKSKIGLVQLSTTSDMLDRANPKAVYPVRTPWPALLATMGLFMLAMGIFALKGLPGDFVPLQPLGVPGSEQVGSILASPTPQSGLPESEKTPDATPTQQVEQSASSQAGQQSDSGSNSSPDPNDPSSQAASQSAQQGLDRLGQGLGEQSVSQQAADSLRQGNYDQAAQQLEEIGRENDQLSDGAKRDLADSLEDAALDPNITPRLRDAAQAAADALRQGDYNKIDQAMRDLGDALKQTAQDVIPQEELAKTFPEQPQGTQPQQGQQGQEGQQSQQGQQEQGQQGQDAQQGNQQGEQSGQTQQGQQSQQGQPQGGQSGQPPQTGEQSQSGGPAAGGGQQNQQNQQGQTGAPGQGTRVGDPTERGDPNVAGNPFEIEGMPDQGRPSSDNERPALTLEGSAAAGEAAPVSPGNAVTAQGESNNMPVERWEIIQRYFGGGR